MYILYYTDIDGNIQNHIFPSPKDSEEDLKKLVTWHNEYCDHLLSQEELDEENKRKMEYMHAHLVNVPDNSLTAYLVKTIKKRAADHRGVITEAKSMASSLERFLAKELY